MDYTVGSLADLISGKNTPNKPKVVKVPIKQTKIKVEDDHDSIQTGPVKLKSKKRNSLETPVKNRKRKSSINSKQEEQTVEPRTKKLRIKKQKPSICDNSTLVDSEEESPIKEEVEEGETEQNVENPEGQLKKKKIKIEQDPEELQRTIFIGNVPINIKKKKIKSVFKKYGEIECLRFRGIPVADPKIPKKVAAIKKEYHPERSTVYCYLRFINKEDAQQAVKENGKLFEGHHLRVHLCTAKDKPDEAKAIFIGNLAFNAEEEDLWKIFEPCGPISSVRIVRDSYTSMGKGFAYVNFQDSDAVQLALEMENVKHGNRELRIKLSSVSTAKKNKKKENKVNATRRTNWKGNKKGKGPGGTGRYNNKIQDGKQTEIKKGFQGPKFNNNEKNATRTNWKHNKKGNGPDGTGQYNNKIQDGKQTEVNNKGFQGSKFNNNKKKFKVNKGALNKQRKIKKIAPNSKV